VTNLRVVEMLAALFTATGMACAAASHMTDSATYTLPHVQQAWMPEDDRIVH